MKKAKRKIKKIIEKDRYSLQDIVRERMFPWAHSFYTVRNIIKRDRKKENILNPIIIGRGRAKKYHFKKENIIEFVRKIESGEIQL